MTEATASTMRRPRPRPSAESDPTPDVDEATGSDAPADEEGALPGALVLGGWSQAQREMDATSSYAQALKPDETMQFVKFLDDKPYANYRRHWIERTGERDGKPYTYKRPYVCLQTVGKRCPLCDIGDRPQAVSCFNVALIGDEGQLDLKSWDVGGKLFNTLKGYHADSKFGPLTKGFFAVNKTKGGNGTTSVNAAPVGPTAARDDYGIKVPTPEQLAAMPRYEANIVDIPKVSDLQEIADEMAED